MKQKTVKMFSLYKNEEKNQSYLKPAVGDFGVKSIVVEMQDGTKKSLTKEDVLFLNDPREQLSRGIEAVDNGSKSDKEKAELIDKLQSKLDKLPKSLAREVVLKL